MTGLGIVACATVSKNYISSHMLLMFVKHTGLRSAILIISLTSE